MADWYDQLHLGDSIEALGGLDPERAEVDLVFADPPYNIGYSYDVYQDQVDDDTYLTWTSDWIQAAARVLKPTGSFWIAIGDEYVAEIKSIAEKAGLVFRNWVIWYYTFGVHCTRKFSRSHTHLLYFVKNAKKFTFNDDAIRVPSARQLVYNDNRADGRGRLPDNTWILRPQDAPGAFTANEDLWFFARVAGTFKERAGFHGCQLPEQLLARVIRCCSNQGDVVLDPFAGSGSTLVVAKKLGRRFVGYELSAEYVQHAGARLASVRQGDPLEGPADPLVSAPATPSARGPRSESPDDDGILEAFRKAADGYAADRVIADPVLNAAFTDQCGALGLAGRPLDWNWSLLALRKTGKLAAVPTARKTRFSWESMDPFIFASEIALRRMLDSGYTSLDHVLCDPMAAARFDEIARSLSPGFHALAYRWAALKLRKEARLWRRSSEKVAKGLMRRKPKQLALEEASIFRLREGPGVYVLTVLRKQRKGTKNKKKVPLAYVGETSNLMGRAERTRLAKSTFDRFVPNSGNWQLGWYELGDLDAAGRRGFQSLLIRQNSPLMNYLELGTSTHA